MKKYILTKIFNTIKMLLIIPVLFLTTKVSINTNVLATAFNENINKTIDKSVMVSAQKELYLEGVYDPIYSFSGDLTGYAGDCPLCSGYLACPPRTNVLKEGIYYYDKTYGTVRIVASSKNYPCGTILQFKVNKLSDEPIIAIVLDRGVGGNSIDLLTENEDYARKYVGRVRNQTFEVLREGWTQ